MKRLSTICLLLVVILVSPLTAQDDFRITDLAWSPDSTLLAVGRTDGVRIYDVSTDSPQIVWSADTEYPVESVQFSPSGEWLAAGTGGYTLQAGFVYIWDANRGEHITSFQANTFAIYALTFSPDSSRLVTGGGFIPTRAFGDYRVRIWDTATWEDLPDHQNEGIAIVSAAAFSPDGTHLAYSHGYTPINLVDLASNSVLASIHETSANAIIFTQDGNILLLCFYNGVEAWAIRHEPEFHLVRQTQWLSPRSNEDRPVAQVIACSPDRFVTSSEGGLLQVRDTVTAEPLFTRTMNMNFSSSAAFSPDGRRLAFIRQTRIAPGGWETTYHVAIWTLDDSDTLLYLDVLPD